MTLKNYLIQLLIYVYGLKSKFLLSFLGRHLLNLKFHFSFLGWHHLTSIWVTILKMLMVWHRLSTKVVPTMTLTLYIFGALFYSSTKKEIMLIFFKNKILLLAGMKWICLICCTKLGIFAMVANGKLLILHGRLSSSLTNWRNPDWQILVSQDYQVHKIDGKYAS